VLSSLRVFAILPGMESQAAPQWLGHDGDCPRDHGDTASQLHNSGVPKQIAEQLIRRSRWMRLRDHLEANSTGG
jgi:hypothetical protein